MKTSRVSIVLTKETIEEFGVVLAAMRRDSKYALCSAGDAWRTIIAAGMQHMRIADHTPIARVQDVDHAPVARVDAAAPKYRTFSKRFREREAEMVVPVVAPKAEVVEEPYTGPVLGEPWPPKVEPAPYVQKRCPPEDVHPDMRWLAVHEEAAKKRGTY